MLQILLCSSYYFFIIIIMVSLKDFLARTAVQRALVSPMRTESVLSFTFGVNYRDAAEIETELRQGGCFQSVANLWWSGGKEYDDVCATFKEAVRAAGKREFLPAQAVKQEDDPNLSVVDGLIAQIVLCDQYPRNIFRGQPEAFAYEEQALEASRQLTSSLLNENECTLEGEIYPPYMTFMLLAFMHSESRSDHEQAVALIEYAKKSSPEHLQKTWDGYMTFELQHKQVVDRFGRYPHRNKSKGRESTPEEEAWLADVDKLPGWAKSQM